MTKVWDRQMGIGFNYDVIASMDISCPYILEGLSAKNQGLASLIKESVTFQRQAKIIKGILI